MSKTEYFLEKMNRKITCSLRIKLPNTKIKTVTHNTTAKHWPEYSLKLHMFRRDRVIKQWYWTNRKTSNILKKYLRDSRNTLHNKKAHDHNKNVVYSSYKTLTNIIYNYLSLFFPWCFLVLFEHSYLELYWKSLYFYFLVMFLGHIKFHHYTSHF